MSTHKNDIVIRNVIDGKIVVSIYGPLSAYSLGLRRKLSQSNGVKNVYIADVSHIADNTAYIVIECDPPRQLTEEQLRIRICNWCRDWVHIVTGVMTNTGASSFQ